MPYLDPEKKREWELTHRADRSREFLELRKAATAYADRQIAILKDSGVEHSASEWKELRSALRTGFRVLPTDRERK